MKKYSSAFLLWSFIGIFIFPNVVSAVNFDDLSKEHPHYDGLEYMVETEAMQGYSDGTIRPDATITRAEFLKILLQGTDHLRLEIGDHKNCFPDVTTEWHARFICYAYNEGWIKGYPDGLFHPERVITFVEVAKIVGAVFFGNLPADEQFWYQPYVEALTEGNDVPLSISSLDKPITRSEAAMLIYSVATRYYNAGKGGFSFLKNGSALRNMGIFSKDLQHVYYNNTVLDLNANTFDLVNNTSCYGKDENYVYYFGHRKDEIDAKTFQQIGKTFYYKDKNTVYYNNACQPQTATIMSEADLATFEALNYYYAKDKNKVYYRGEPIDADPESLTLLRKDIFDARDKNSVFRYGKKVQGLPLIPFIITDQGYLKDEKNIYFIKEYRGKDGFYNIAESVPKADPATFQYLRIWYAKDKNNVYRIGDSSQHDIIIYEADPFSFEVSPDSAHAKDKNHIYYGEYALPESDGSSAVLMNSGYAKDAQHVYYLKNILPEADPATFESLGDGYAKDKNSVFYFLLDDNKIIEGADPKTFKVTRLDYAKDSKNIYYEGKASKRKYLP